MAQILKFHDERPFASGQRKTGPTKTQHRGAQERDVSGDAGQTYRANALRNSQIKESVQQNQFYFILIMNSRRGKDLY